MGKIIEVRFEDLMPGELGFQPVKLLEIIKQERLGNSFLPPPARESESVVGKKVHLDGRHRILYKKMTGEEGLELFVVNSQEDAMTAEYLPGLPKRLIRNNHFIALRWEEADKFAGRLKVKDYNEYFERLVASYPFMKDIDSFLKFSNKNASDNHHIYGLPDLIGLSEC